MLLIFTKIALAACGYLIGVIGINNKGINQFNTAAFSTGFIFDVWATYDMYALNPMVSLSAHSFVGIAALLFASILQIAVIVGMQFQRHKQRAEKIFGTVSYWFLLVWCIAVFLGIGMAAMRHAMALSGGQ